MFRPGRWLLIGGFVSWQDVSGDKKMEKWFSPIFITSYSGGKRVKLALRLEYFSDENNFVIPQSTPVAGFKTLGFSGNIDIKLLKDCMLRFEYHKLKSKEDVYTSDEWPMNSNRSVAAALLFWLE